MRQSSLRSRIAVVVAVAVLAAAPSHHALAAAAPGRAGRGDRANAERREGARGQELADLIDALRLMRMQRHLSLSEEQVAKVVSIQSRRRREMQEADDTLRSSRAQVSQMLREKAKDKALSKAVDEYYQALRARVSGEIDTAEAINEVLTPEQRARFVVLRDRFNAQLKETIERVQKRRQGKLEGGAPSGDLRPPPERAPGRRRTLESESEEEGEGSG